MAVSPAAPTGAGERAAPAAGPRRAWSPCRPTSSSSGAPASSPRESPSSTRRRSPTSAFATASRSASRVARLRPARALADDAAPSGRHVAVAGLLSHAGYLGGSHYAQRWGLSAGVTALVLALQPLLTAVIVSRWLHERLGALQKVGVGVGLAGVALVVGERAPGRHRDRSPASSPSSGRLLCVTGGHALPAPVLRRQRPARRGLHPLRGDRARHAAARRRRRRLRHRTGTRRSRWRSRTTSSSARSAPISILHLLMRHGQATGVTSLLYLTPPVAALVEWAVFGVAPTLAMWVGMAIACVGVAMATVDAGRLARGTLVEERS